MTTNIHNLSYLAQFFLEWEIFQTIFIEKIEINILCSINFYFRRSCRLWENVGKYSRAGQVTYDNTAHAHCTLHTYDSKYTFHTICYSITTMAVRKSVKVLLYVRFLSG